MRFLYSDRVDRAIRQIKRQEDLMKMTSESHQLAREVVAIQQRIKSIQTNQQEELSTFYETIESFEADVSRLTSEVEPVTVLFERLQELQQSAAGLYIAVEGAHGLIKGTKCPNRLISHDFHRQLTLSFVCSCALPSDAVPRSLLLYVDAENTYQDHDIPFQ